MRYPSPHRAAAHAGRRAHRALVAGALLLFAVAAPAAAEALTYRWSLRGFAGRVAGLVLPNEGKGELRTEAKGAGYVTELEITSPKSGKGEYFLYGSETRGDGYTTEAWSSYRWRGEEKSKRDRVSTPDVVDVASGIRLIRERSPKSPLRLRIWSDGKVYPVTVQRVATENVHVPAGVFRTDHYRVRGVRADGQRYWKGGIDLWLAQDAERTPVAIQVERGMANVRLELMPEPAGGSPTRGRR